MRLSQAAVATLALASHSWNAAVPLGTCSSASFTTANVRVVARMQLRDYEAKPEEDGNGHA